MMSVVVGHCKLSVNRIREQYGDGNTNKRTETLDLSSRQILSDREEALTCSTNTMKRHNPLEINNCDGDFKSQSNCLELSHDYPSRTKRVKYSKKRSKNLVPSSSLLRFFLFGQFLVLLMQFHTCESSTKWWSIVHASSAEPTDSSYDSSRRHFRRSGVNTRPSTLTKQKTTYDLYKTLRDIDPDDVESFLSDETIREILSNTDFGAVDSSEGFGTFPEKSNNKRRDVTNNRIDDITKLSARKRENIPQGFYTTNSNIMSTNMRPPIVMDQTIQILNRKQRRMLRRNPGALQEIVRSIKRAIKECKFQFRNRRWTCPTDSRDNTLFGKILNEGFRETAFIYAITSAAVSHAIAKACNQGTISTCGCDGKTGPGGPGWEWGGCSDNFKFGRKFAKEFVDAGELGVDLKYRMNLHNNEAGRQTVNEKSVRHCKCHGMSGSCTVQTCWLKASDFRTVGRRLRDKYDDAVEVTISNQGSIKKGEANLIPTIPAAKPPKKQDLVYFENSPSFCIKDSDFWTEGTKGRVCNATSSGYNGCDSMCCGRGYKTRTKVVKTRCKCQFQWCCSVKCEICESTKQISVCK